MMRPLFNQVLTKPVGIDDAKVNRTEGGLVLPIPEERANRVVLGRVLAVGPGDLLPDGTVRPVPVKEGDVVAYSLFAGTEMIVRGKSFMIVRDIEILAVLDPADLEKASEKEVDPELN